MRRRTVLASCLLLWSLLVLSGCGPAKLNVSKTWQLEAGSAQVLDLDAQAKEQKLTVAFSSSEGDVYVYVIKDFKERDGLDSSPTKAQIMDSKQAKEGSLSVDVSPNTPIRVVVRGASAKTDVTLSVTNAK